MNTLAHPYTYMDALEDQLRGIKGLKDVLQIVNPAQSVPEMVSVWKTDLFFMQRAVPFAWSSLPIQAVREASASIPLDTQINKWNMPVVVFWHFETPLPFQTVYEPAMGIKALSIALLKHQHKETGQVHTFYHVGTWLEDPNLGFTGSTSFRWREDETIVEMLERARISHYETYDREDAPFKDMPSTDIEITLATVRQLAQFIIAGQVWLNQKVLMTAEEHIERHRRKDFNRQTGQNLTHLQVVNLRKTAFQNREESDPSGRTYTHQWVVAGHWRQQACGPQMSKRRLTFVIPHLKGPKDAPLLEHKPVVFKVDR